MDELLALLGAAIGVFWRSFWWVIKGPVIIVLAVIEFIDDAMQARDFFRRGRGEHQGSHSLIRSEGGPQTGTFLHGASVFRDQKRRDEDRQE